ncbi:MAG: alpha/beta fold hydrolase [Chloroflexota bacterium]
MRGAGVCIVLLCLWGPLAHVHAWQMGAHRQITEEALLAVADPQTTRVAAASADDPDSWWSEPWLGEDFHRFRHRISVFLLPHGIGEGTDRPGAEVGAAFWAERSKEAYQGSPHSNDWRKYLGYASHFLADALCPPHCTEWERYERAQDSHSEFEQAYAQIPAEYVACLRSATPVSFATSADLSRWIVEQAWRVRAMGPPEAERDYRSLLPPWGYAPYSPGYIYVTELCEILLDIGGGIQGLYAYVTGASDSRPPLSTYQIVFVRQGNLWIMRADGGDVRQLTRSGDCHSPVCSPDGRTLFYCRGGRAPALTDDDTPDAEDARIWRYDLKAGAAEFLTRGNNPAVSPDGSQLAFDRFVRPPPEGNQCRRQVYVRRLDSGAERAVIRDLSQIDYFEGPTVEGWTIDGERLLLGAGDCTAGSQHIYQVSLDDGRLVERYGYLPRPLPGRVVIGRHCYHCNGGSSEIAFVLPEPIDVMGEYPLWPLNGWTASPSPTGRWIADIREDTDDLVLTPEGDTIPQTLMELCRGLYWAWRGPDNHHPAARYLELFLFDLGQSVFIDIDGSVLQAPDSLTPEELNHRWKPALGHGEEALYWVTELDENRNPLPSRSVLRLWRHFIFGSNELPWLGDGPAVFVTAIPERSLDLSVINPAAADRDDDQGPFWFEFALGPWSPDEQWLSLLDLKHERESDEIAGSSLWLITRDGSERRQVAEGVEDLLWLPPSASATQGVGPGPGPIVPPVPPHELRNYAPEGAEWQLWAFPATLAKEQPNVLLIHGFSLQRLLGTVPLYWQAYLSFWTGFASPLDPARCDNRFGQLPALLSAEGYNVWQFEYEDRDGNTAASVQTYAAYLERAIEVVQQETAPQPISIIAHSMGGVIARTYLQYLRGYEKVNKLVTLGTPHFGSFAWGFLPDDWAAGVAKCSVQLRPYSSFLWNLNTTFEPEKYGVDFACIAGTPGGKASDGLVDCSSARLVKCHPDGTIDEKSTNRFVYFTTVACDHSQLNDFADEGHPAYATIRRFLRDGLRGMPTGVHQPVGRRSFTFTSRERISRIALEDSGHVYYPGETGFPPDLEREDWQRGGVFRGEEIEGHTIWSLVLPAEHEDVAGPAMVCWRENGDERSARIYVDERQSTVRQVPIPSDRDEPPTAVIKEDFADDTGLWTYQGSAQRDAAHGYVLLTPAEPNQVGVLWLNAAITQPFTAEFRYRAGGGSGADGLVFMFYKDRAYKPYDGSCLGFAGVAGPILFMEPPLRGLWWSTHDAVAGYGIELDSWQSSQPDVKDPAPAHIALIKDSPNNHLAWVEDPRVADGQWHQVTVDVTSSSVTVTMDGDNVLRWRGQLDRRHTSLGFAASTGGYTNEHLLDDVCITLRGDGEVSTPLEAPAAVIPDTEVTSPDGRRRAWAEERPGHKMVWVIDGKPTPEYTRWWGEEGVDAEDWARLHLDRDYYQSGEWREDWDREARLDWSLRGGLLFSPDSQRVAYVAAEGLEKQFVVVDGKRDPHTFSCISWWDEIVSSLAFSPDSKHLAYVACPQNEPGYFLVIDGVPQELTGGIEVFHWSPNSKGLYYVAHDLQEPGKWRLHTWGFHLPAQRYQLAPGQEAIYEPLKLLPADVRQEIMRQGGFSEAEVEGGVGALAPQSEATGTLAPGSGALVLTVVGEEDEGLWLLSADGATARELGMKLWRWVDPALAPAGDMMAVLTADWDGTDRRLEVVTLAGEVVRSVPPPEDLNVHWIAWSPSGEAIALAGSRFGEENEESVGLWLLAPLTGHLRKLSSVPRHLVLVDEMEAAWAPDSRAIAVATGEGLFIVNVADGAVQTAVEGRVRGPVWAPDGSQVAYESDDRIAVLDVESGGHGNLTEGGTPAWSPDGTRIAFMSDEEVWVSEADGSNRVCLSDRPGVEWWPCLSNQRPGWSPDGTSVLVLRLVEGREVPCILPIREGEARYPSLLNPQLQDKTISWANWVPAAGTYLAPWEVREAVDTGYWLEKHWELPAEPQATECLEMIARAQKIVPFELFYPRTLDTLRLVDLNAWRGCTIGCHLTWAEDGGKQFTLEQGGNGAFGPWGPRPRVVSLEQGRKAYLRRYDDPEGGGTRLTLYLGWQSITDPPPERHEVVCTLDSLTMSETELIKVANMLLRDPEFRQLWQPLRGDFRDPVLFY